MYVNILHLVKSFPASIYCLPAKIGFEREAKSRVKEKKPPKAAINLGTDVDAPWGEKIETSRKDNHQNA